MSKSEKFWDKSAEKYSKSAIADEISYQRKLQETQSLLSEEMNVLEFGCGTGTTALHHASHVKHIDAIDISENMLTIGREKAKQAGVDNIRFKRCTLTELDAQPASYDVVLGLSILHLLPDRLETLNQVVHFLKPGGIFVSSTACLGDSFIRHMKLVAPIAKLLGLMPDFYVVKEQDLLSEISGTGLRVDQNWHHGGTVKVAFIVASKQG